MFGPVVTQLVTQAVTSCHVIKHDGKESGPPQGWLSLSLTLKCQPYSHASWADMPGTTIPNGCTTGGPLHVIPGPA
jgi:hypothetical protein